jgi:hypothetical protein
MKRIIAVSFVRDLIENLLLSWASQLSPEIDGSANIHPVSSEASILGMQSIDTEL